MKGIKSFVRNIEHQLYYPYKVSEKQTNQIKDEQKMGLKKLLHSIFITYPPVAQLVKT